MQKLLLTLLAVVMVAACAESKKSRGQANSRGARTQNPGGASGTGGGGQAATQGMGCSGDFWGVIYASSDTQSTWQQRVVNFASASVLPSEIGMVSPSDTASDTGISFCGRICNRNPPTAPSEVYIGIWDEFFSQGKYPEEISVNIRDGGANNGRLVNRSAPVVFEDAYGWVEFIGLTSGASGVVTGEFWYANKVKIGNDGQTMTISPSREKLGNFRIRADRFFRTDC